VGREFCGSTAQVGKQSQTIEELRGMEGKLEHIDYRDRDFLHQYDNLEIIDNK